MPDATVPVTRPAPQPSARPLVRLAGLKRFFDVSPPLLARVLEGKPRAIVQAVAGIDIEIAKGETFSLVGESGCGKSTVARLIVGLLRPSRGRVLFEGTDIAAIGRRRELQPFRRRMQMIFQDPYASLNPRWRVRRIIEEPMRFLNGNAPRRERVAELLRQVGLSPDDAERYPHEFSGGQRQRISIARALAGEPELLICDEPTSALDVSVQAQILNLMADLQERLGLTYLFISHNLAVVSLVADRVGVMYLGRLVEMAPTAELFARPRHPYTRMLLDAVPDLGMTGKPRTPVRGEVPNPLAPPPGCAFHPRCPHANERCRFEIPAVINSVACHGVEEGRI